MKKGSELLKSQAFYRSMIMVLVALIYGLLLMLMNVYWDEAPMLFVFGLLLIPNAWVIE